MQLTPEDRTFLFRLACVWLAAMSLVWYAKPPPPTAPEQAADTEPSGLATPVSIDRATAEP